MRIPVGGLLFLSLLVSAASAEDGSGRSVWAEQRGNMAWLSPIRVTVGGGKRRPHQAVRGRPAILAVQGGARALGGRNQG